MFEEACLKTRRTILLSPTRSLILLLMSAALSLPAMAQGRMGVETSEGLFTVMASINACGYDADMGQSLPLRARVRDEVLKAAQTPEAQTALRNLCNFYDDHLQDTAARTLSNYVSLGLNLADGPQVELRTAEANLPPDAIFVLGAVPLLQKLSRAADLDAIWKKHRADYQALVAQLHKPVNDTLLGMDFYLRRTQSGFVKHDFIVYVEPLAAPGEINSRNYGDDYYVVLSPSATAAPRLDQVRHTYLHYIFDAKVMTRGTTLRRLSALLQTVQAAPLEEAYRFDIGLLLTESLIKAVEARLLGGPKGDAKEKDKYAWEATRQGFILTWYFNDKLKAFEHDEVDLDQAYGDWLHDIDVEKIQKFAADVPFEKSGSQELVRRVEHRDRLVELAERALASGNLAGAQNYAQQAIENKEDQGRALFVLARTAIAGGKLEDAQGYFTRAANVSSDVKIKGWSNIYLGRIADLQEHREQAVEHYRIARDLDGPPELKAAAEKGLQQAYQAAPRHDNQ